MFDFTLLNTNKGENFRAGDFCFPLSVCKEDDKLAIIDENGKRIAYLSVEVATDDDGQPVSDYFLSFKAAKKENSIDDGVIFVPMSES